MTATEDERTSDHIQAALDELSTLGIVRSVDTRLNRVTLDVARLYSIGYSILFESTQPTFVKNEHTMFMFDCVLFLDDTVPLESLRSYRMLKLKNEGVSP